MNDEIHEINGERVTGARHAAKLLSEAPPVADNVVSCNRPR